MRSGTPYVSNVAPEVTVSFTSITASVVGTYTNYVAGAGKRLVYVETDEEPYTGKGVIRLLNQDGALNTVPFIGSLCFITWGYHGGSPSTDQPMWVTQATNISIEGKLIVELQLANAWEMLQHSKGINAAISTDLSTAGVGSTRVWQRTTKIKDILTAIVGDTNGFLGQWNYTSLTWLADDGIVNVYQPFVATRLIEDDRQLIRRILQMSQSVITFRSATGATLNWIDPSIPGPYYEYQLGNGSVYHPFFSWINGNFLPIPNRIFYADVEPDPIKNVIATYVGSAVDATSVAAIGGLADVFYDSSISSNVEANLRATSHLARIQAEGAPGEIYSPMNCCQELYDAIKVTDARNGSVVGIGRVGRIQRHFEANANDLTKPSTNPESYTIRIHLGGIGGGSLRTKSYTGSNDIDAAANDMATRGLRNPFVDSPQYDQSVLSQHYAPQKERRPASSNRTLTVAGGLQVIAGATITLPIVPIASEADVDAMFEVSPGAGVAAGDVVACILDLDGVAYNSALIFGAASATDAKTLSGKWVVPIPADGVAHVLALKAQMISGGAGTWNILSAGTNIIMELSAGKNTRLF